MRGWTIREEGGALPPAPLFKHAQVESANYPWLQAGAPDKKRAHPFAGRRRGGKSSGPDPNPADRATGVWSAWAEQVGLVSS